MSNTIIVAGAHKAGTTTLFAILDQHPEISMSVVKETNHYCRDLWALLGHVRHFGLEDIQSLHAKGERIHIGVIKDREAYISAFPAKPESKYRGEASPFYLRSSDAAKEIARDCPDAKIILILRDPIDRLLSHYCMEIRDARIPEPIELAISEELILVSLGEVPIHGLLDSGLYGQGLSRFLDHFPSDQILLLDFSELSNPETLIPKVADFLQVDRYGFTADMKRQNESLAARNPLLNRLIAKSGAKELIRKLVPKYVIEAIKPLYYKPQAKNYCVNEKLFEELIAFYREDVKRLKNLVGNMKLNWTDKYLQ